MPASAITPPKYPYHLPFPTTATPSATELPRRFLRERSTANATRSRKMQITTPATNIDAETIISNTVGSGPLSTPELALSDGCTPPYMASPIPTAAQTSPGTHEKPVQNRVVSSAGLPLTLSQDCAPFSPSDLRLKMTPPPTAASSIPPTNKSGFDMNPATTSIQSLRYSPSPLPLTRLRPHTSFQHHPSLPQGIHPMAQTMPRTRRPRKTHSSFPRLLPHRPKRRPLARS